jgi:hypothetical protein
MSSLVVARSGTSNTSRSGNPAPLLRHHTGLPATAKCTGIGVEDRPRSSTGTPWFSDQKIDLLDQVLAKEVGPRDRGRIGAGDG